MPTKTSTISLISRHVVAQQRYGMPGGLGDYNISNTSVASTGYACTRTGSALPKWQSIIKSGGNATTTFSGQRTRRLSLVPFGISNGFYPVTGDASGYTEDVSGSVPSYNAQPGHIGSASLVKAENLALISALKRVRQQREQVQGLTVLGELRETLQMLKHPFQGVRKYVDQYFTDLRKMQKGRPGNQSRVKRQESFLTTAGGAWLEVSFGIKPLLSDVKGIAEAIARHEFDSRRSIVVGYGEDVAVLDAAFEESYGNYTIVRVKRRDRTTYSVRYKVYLDYSRSTDFQSNNRLLELVGFTPENFIPTVYELVPWSWLLDYFSNVGQVLEAGCTSQNEIKFTVRTQRLETTRVDAYVPGLSNPAGLSRFWTKPRENGESILSRATVSRASAGALDTPTFESTLPGSPTKWVNMLAVWATMEDSLTKGLRARGR